MILLLCFAILWDVSHGTRTEMCKFSFEMCVRGRPAGHRSGLEALSTLCDCYTARCEEKVLLKDVWRQKHLLQPCLKTPNPHATSEVVSHNST